MEVLYDCCAGLDVHKKTITVCVLRRDRGPGRKAIRTFGTMTRDLLALSEWLGANGVTHVAMESTGVFWKPVFNILEGSVQVLLVNARHIKQVPGRKTDVTDCEWIAELLQHGLLKASYIPKRPQRELRDLTRHRAQLVAERARVANRVQKLLEDANIKLASVATNTLGVSGRAMLEALAAGEREPEALAELARGRLRKKLPELRQALEGLATGHHRFLLKVLLDHLACLEGLTDELDRRIEACVAPFEEEIGRLCTLPGVDRLVAQALVAEIGVDMDPFPSAAHLASWAGLCPGNQKSAGKRQSGRTTHGNRWLRRSLSQAAWAASHTKATYLSAQFRRLSRRRGRKRAIVAVAHTILTMAYHMLKDQTTYTELGPDYFDRRGEAHLRRSLVSRLSKLGYSVQLHPQTQVA